MKSNLLSKSITSKTLEEIANQWKIDLPKLKSLMIHEIDENSGLITGDNFSSIKINELYIPFLSETAVLEKFAKIVVDMGAVKFVCNGANVMRPGIKNYEQFEKDQLVTVADESRNKFLAIGRTLVSSQEMEQMKKGEVLKNLHYVSDKYWEAAKEIKR